MPYNLADDEPPHEEPGKTMPPDAPDDQGQDSPRGHGGKTLLEHGREAMEEHAELGRLLAQ